MAWGKAFFNDKFNTDVMLIYCAFFSFSSNNYFVELY